MITPALIAFLIVPSVANAIVLFGTRNVALKKRLLPWLFALSDATFISFVRMIGFPIILVALLGVCVIVLSIGQYRSVRFCSKCGRTSIGRLFQKSRHCIECGTALGDA